MVSVHVHKSWKAAAEALEVGGAGSWFLGILFLVMGDLIGAVILFVIGVPFLIAGIKLKRWAKKNGKE